MTIEKNQEKTAIKEEKNKEEKENMTLNVVLYIILTKTKKIFCECTLI